jgi:hypothetical protein
MLAASDHKLIAFDLIVRRSNCTLAGGDDASAAIMAPIFCQRLSLKAASNTSLENAVLGGVMID